MKGIFETCKPRSDILAGKVSDEVYAANLGQVKIGSAPDVYQNPDRFFRNTYVTIGLKTVIKESFLRLAGVESGSSLIKLETSLGGGKTHTLISLYHLAKEGNTIESAKDLVGDLDLSGIKVAAVIGTDMGVVAQEHKPNTIWGEIAKGLFGDAGYEKIKESDRLMRAPGEEIMRDLFGDNKCLILIDELAQYLVKASTVQVGGSNLAMQTVAFLQELSGAAASCPNVVVVITSLDRSSVFGDETEMIMSGLDRYQAEKAMSSIKSADDIASRVVRPLTPTRGEEFSGVVRQRLFESVDMEAADSTVKEYFEYLNDEMNSEYISTTVRNPAYIDSFLSSYPFHPELINILRTKTSSVPSFNKTRGVLRLLSKVVRKVWEEGVDKPLIHPYEVDLRRQEFIDEVVSRLNKGDYQAAIAADVSNKHEKPRAMRVDDIVGDELGSKVANVVFLNSITGSVDSDVVHGAKEMDIMLSIGKPGFDLKKAQNALKALEEQCFYLVRKGVNYTFQTEPNINKLIESAKDAVERTKAKNMLNERIKKMFGGKRYFQPMMFPNLPSDVPDDTENIKMLLMHFDDCSIPGKSVAIPELVHKLYQKTGTVESPRIYGNSLFFLVADPEQVKKMESNVVKYLAIDQLLRDKYEGQPYISSLSNELTEELEKRKSEEELYMKVAIAVAYRHIIVPSSQSDLDNKGRRPLRLITMRVTDTEAKEMVRRSEGHDKVIVEFLRDNDLARTTDDKDLSPEFIRQQLWPRDKDSVAADDFKKMFYRNPAVPLIMSDEIILKTLKKGIQDGKWVIIHDNHYYDNENHSAYYGAFSAGATIILTNTEEQRKYKAEYVCDTCGCKKPCDCEAVCKDCGKKKSECDCVVVETCPRCLMPLHVCTCEVSPKAISVTKVKMDRAATDLRDLVKDKGITRVKTLKITANDRNAFSKLCNSLPQFGSVQQNFDVDATLDQKPQGGNFLQIRYSGAKKGFESVKPLLINYESGSKFSRQSLIVSFEYGGAVVDDVIDTIGDKVSKFTGDEVYSIELVPGDE